MKAWPQEEYYISVDEGGVHDDIPTCLDQRGPHYFEELGDYASMLWCSFKIVQRKVEFPGATPTVVEHALGLRKIYNGN